MFRKQWRMAAAVVAILILALAVTACTPTPTPPPPPPDKPPTGELPELILAMSEEVEGTDPQQASNISWFVGGLIGTPIMSLGVNNDQILPWGADEVEVAADGMQIRLTFSGERTFHNGVPVTAEAVKASIERYLEVSPYAFDYEDVTEMTVDGDVLVLDLAVSGPALNVVLGSSYSVPVEVGAAADMGDEAFHRAVVADGPFKVEEWVDGSHITLVRNDDYVDYLPSVSNNGPFNFSKVTVRFIVEAFTRVSELRAGNVHMISGIPSEMLGTLRDDPDVDLLSYLNSNTRYLQMNTNKFPFDNKAVRMAIAYAVDRDQLDEALDGAIEPLYTLVGKAMISHDPDTEARMAEQFAHNAEKAIQTLTDDGWAKGTDGVMAKGGQRLSFELAINQGSSTDRMAGPIIQAQLAAAGIEVDLREYETRYTRQMVVDREFDMVLSNWSWLDPGGVWPATLRTGGSRGVWFHPEVDELLNAAIVVPDPAERAAAWGRLSERVWQDAPLIPVWSDRIYLAKRSNLENVEMTVSGTIYFHDAILK